MPTADFLNLSQFYFSNASNESAEAEVNCPIQIRPLTQKELEKRFQAMDEFRGQPQKPKTAHVLDEHGNKIRGF